jgi:hypothetical protein
MVPQTSNGPEEPPNNNDKEGKDLRCTIRGEFTKVRLQSPYSQVLISPSHQMMVRSSRCWLKWKNKKEDPGIKAVPAAVGNQFHLSSLSGVD